jgi:hypothetical protein
MLFYRTIMDRTYLAESSEEGYDLKRDVLLMIMTEQ